MSRAGLGTAGIVLVALLAFPRTATANILDMIWEMSGPQLIGIVVLHCKIDLQGRPGECRSVDVKLPDTPTRELPARFWVSMEAAGYFSTGKNSGQNEFEAFRIGMAGLDAALEVRSGSYKGWTFYHGLAGVTYNYLFGKGFDSFDKIGLKFRPIGVTRGRWIDLALNIRAYPNGFGSDELGFAPRLGQVDRPLEVTYGLSWGRSW
jgi:hypothetical protein